MYTVPCRDACAIGENPLQRRLSDSAMNKLEFKDVTPETVLYRR